MRYEEIKNDRIKRMIRINNYCPICYNRITKSDNIQFITFREGRTHPALIFHQNCLIQQAHFLNKYIKAQIEPLEEVE